MIISLELLEILRKIIESTEGNNGDEEILEFAFVDWNIDAGII